MNKGKFGHGTRSTKMGADSPAEKIPNASKNFSPKYLSKPKCSKFLKKSSLWVSVVRKPIQWIWIWNVKSLLELRLCILVFTRNNQTRYLNKIAINKYDKLVSFIESFEIVSFVEISENQFSSAFWCYFLIVSLQRDP